MASIDKAVTDLQAIDTAVLAALGGGVLQLQAQLAHVQSDLAALQAVDADNVAERDDAIAKLAQSQADAQTAADSIEAEVSKLTAATTPPAG